MRFSIITCTYNSEKYLWKNIETLKKQNFRDFEHIFIDGNSTDKTLQIINKYKEEYPYIVKVYSQKPGGISKAMNEGIKRSSGEYIIHLHSDDSLYNNNVLDCINDFLSKNNYDWIYGKANIVESNNKTSIGCFPNRRLLQYNYKSNFGKYFLKYFNYIPHQSVFIKREIFDKYGYFDESITSAMDPDLWLRIRNKTKWTFLDIIVCNYMIRNDAQSSSIKNIKQNHNNWKKVIRRHTNIIEFYLVLLFNRIVNLFNKTLR